MNNWIMVQDTQGNPAAIPFDNISHIVSVEGTTRIYLRDVAGMQHGILWYVLTHESVTDIVNRMFDAAVP